MIKELRSDRESFKRLKFRSGLNVLLADKSEGSHDRQSRNGAGKTSFVELVHFLLGAEAQPKKSIFRASALRDWRFYANITISGNDFVVSRKGNTPSKVQIKGPLRELAGISDSLFDSESRVISNKLWKSILGSMWFDLPIEVESQVKHSPTFRSLFPLFARRQESGGFHTPTKHTVNLPLWSEQQSISYLLGLDHTIPGGFRALKVREQEVAQLRTAYRSKIAGQHRDTAAELTTKLTVATARTSRLRAELDRFRVVPKYRDLEIEADHLTNQVGDLAAQNVAERTLVSELESSFVAEEFPEVGRLQKLYFESGIILPELPRRRFEEVARFHQTIVQNRRSHLQAEIESAKQRIDQREQQKHELDDRRRQIMEVLQSGGALKHYTRLREELGRAEGEVEVLRQRRRDAERLETARTDIDLGRSRLLKALQDDIRERDEIVREAILRFESLSEALYERAGSLTISATKTGPRFEVHIDAERSKGITNMQIFCFDLMLAEMRASYEHSPNFLIHDSHLFDGVDERQVAKALQLGSERAEAIGLQYIVTLNSDAVPKEGFGPQFDLRDHYISTRLTDATETGGLFGIRFN